MPKAGESSARDAPAARRMSVEERRARLALCHDLASTPLEQELAA